MSCIANTNGPVLGFTGNEVLLSVPCDQVVGNGVFCHATEFVHFVSQMFVYRGPHSELNLTEVDDVYEHVDLSCSGITDIAAIKLHDRVLSLNISDNPIGDIREIMVPPKLESLCMALISIDTKTMAGIRLPETIKGLDISRNYIHIPQMLYFPPSLVTLDISNNQITSLSGVDFPRTLKTLYCQHNNIATIRDIVFPDSLTTLSLRDNFIRSLDWFEFPPGVEYIDLSANEILTMKDVQFPSKVKYLNLAKNAIDSIQGMSIPATLIELYLAYNQLSTVKDLKLPRSLRVLSLAMNNIRDVCCLRLPPTLEMIDLEKTRVTDVTGVMEHSMKYHKLYSRTSTLKLTAESEVMRTKWNHVRRSTDAIVLFIAGKVLEPSLCKKLIRFMI